jgi:hypothetical protein
MTATKVVRFVAHRPEDLRSWWRDVLGAEGAPVRVELSTAITLLDLPAPSFAAVDVLWFADGAAAADHDAWFRANAPAIALDDDSRALVVEEVVVRGADHLAARRLDGNLGYKMMSFGRRSPDLSRAQFVERWRREAGRMGGEVIPDDVRGQAYVQDHPVGDEVAFDALNEVWFDRLDDLHRRAEWFAARPVPADLMDPAQCWSLYLREERLI